jgi:hypothetical protein
MATRARKPGKTGTIVPVLPETESQARPLTSLPTPALQQQAWQEVTRRAEEDGQVNLLPMGNILPG